MNDLEIMSSDDSSTYEDEENYCETDQSVKCLFCEFISHNVDASIDHCKSTHGFDIYIFRDKHRLTYYDYIKVINYIRTKNSNANELMSLEDKPWKDEIYLKPHDQSDPWLWNELNGLIEDEDMNEPKYVNSENGNITLSRTHFNELQERTLILEKLLAEKEKQMEGLRKLMNESETKMCLERPGDVGYFSSYSSLHIHSEMLRDSVRMKAFVKVFLDNKDYFVGKRVLDVGCGTGILSMLAASAGANEVVGVDESDIVYSGMEIIRENGLEAVVSLKRGRIEELELEGKFDVIVSEWMGYCLLFEGMLDSVLHARDTYLKKSPEDLLLPNRCQLWIAAHSDLQTYEEKLGFWDNVVGYKMSPLARQTLSEAHIEHITEKSLSSPPECLLSLDLSSCSVEDIASFTSNFTLTLCRDGTLTGLCCWFDVQFDTPTPVVMTTSPQTLVTHWKQTLFLLSSPISGKSGDIIKGLFSVNRPTQDSRSLNIDICLEGREKQTFVLA